MLVPHWLSNPRTLMQILLSIGLASTSVFVILSQKFDVSVVHWAYGTLGTIMGFWMRGVK